MKRLLLAVLLAGVAASGQSQATTKAGGAAGDSGQALVIEVTIPAPLRDVWQAFTTKEGLSTWLAPDVSVDLKPGGDWLVKFPGSTGGGTILSFVPEKELVISALAPDRFPHVRAARTRAVFTFRAHGNSTVVRLTQTGWQSGPEWDAAYEYLVAGNGQLLGMLHHRFVAGPVDWKKSEQGQ
ncbi:MAG TPA: SRPBCC domain-containing protein [Terracidiphilus sp.]